MTTEVKTCEECGQPIERPSMCLTCMKPVCPHDDCRRAHAWRVHGDNPRKGSL